jgi:hypothetical protein
MKNALAYFKAVFQIVNFDFVALAQEFLIDLIITYTVYYSVV